MRFIVKDIERLSYYDLFYELYGIQLKDLDISPTFIDRSFKTLPVRYKYFIDFVQTTPALKKELKQWLFSSIPNKYRLIKLGVFLKSDVELVLFKMKWS